MGEPAELQALLQDHASGAREIVHKLLLVLQRQATQSKAATATQLTDELFATGAKAVQAHPEMASLFNVLDEIMRGLESNESLSTDVGSQRMEALALLGQAQKANEARLVATARHAASLVVNGDVILCHSRSTSVLEALRVAKADGKVFDVIVTESRPLMEGRALARELNEAQIPVRLLVDAASMDALDTADRVFVGADALVAQGLVNKVGTRLLAAAAKAAGVPVVAALDSTKAWRRAQGYAELARPPRPANEVWETPPLGIDVVNPTYDVTPYEALAHLALEDGVFSPRDVLSRVARTPHARRVAQVFIKGSS
jgi:translation initiation factor 2B subunit (eIF-2B alpha/beta/delta family)